MKGGFLPLCLGVRWGLNGRDQQPRPWACWGWGEGPPPRVGNRRAQRAYRRSRGPAGEGDQQLHLGDGTAHQWGRAAVPRGPPGLEAGGQPLRTSRPAGGCPLPRACQVSRGRATIMPGGPPPFPGARQGSRGGGVLPLCPGANHGLLVAVCCCDWGPTGGPRLVGTAMVHAGLSRVASWGVRHGALQTTGDWPAGEGSAAVLGDPPGVASQGGPLQPPVALLGLPSWWEHPGAQQPVMSSLAGESTAAPSGLP